LQPFAGKTRYDSADTPCCQEITGLFLGSERDFSEDFKPAEEAFDNVAIFEGRPVIVMLDHPVDFGMFG
jgi:hypothetical protein